VQGELKLGGGFEPGWLAGGGGGDCRRDPKDGGLRNQVISLEIKPGQGRGGQGATKGGVHQNSTPG